MPKRVRMRSATHASAVRSPGRRRRRRRRLFGVLGSLPSRPAPARLAPRNSLFGAADFLVVPHKSKAWGPGGSRKYRLAIPQILSETEVAVGGRLGEAGSDGTVGKSGAELRGCGVCVGVGVFGVCGCVFGLCWLRRSARAPRVGGRGRQSASRSGPP